MSEETSVLSDTMRFRQAGGDGRPSLDESPLRSELFSAQQMAHHGRFLGGLHRLSTRRHPERLLGRLSENAQLIKDACAVLAAPQDGCEPTPAAECLLDHRHLIGEEVRRVRRALSPQDSRALPRLDNANAAGVPRVYQLALELVAHGDGRIGRDSLSAFIDAYQERAPLLLRELWALPSMLRLALIENLRRAAAQVRDNRLQRDRAREWAARMAATAADSPSDLVLVVADMARSSQSMSTAFVAELARRLQGQGPALAPALQWIGTRLAESGLSVEQQIGAEMAAQAADQVSIANSVASLRLLGAIDWQDVVEKGSGAEQVLRRDPAGLYAGMDAGTRERYRLRVEELARAAAISELQVAEQALEMALEHRDLAAGGLDARTRHVGYYLVGRGAPRLEERLRVRLAPRERLARRMLRAPLAPYFGAIALFTALFTAAGLRIALDDLMPLASVILLGLLLAIAASQLALALVNYFAGRHVQAAPLPRMDYSGGVPDSARTLVVLPAVIHNPDNAAALCEAMEVHFLANRDPNIRFCLLTDFADAPAQHLPQDDDLLAQLRLRVEALNMRYRFEAQFDAVDDEGEPVKRRQTVEPFALLHRPREWNEAESVWMGSERKRGKLAALHAFLHGGSGEVFACIGGGAHALSGVRYVITLDTHTQLPRGAARQFIGAIDHPLNRPQLDMAQRLVVDGYGILQPRIEAALPGEHASPWELLCGGEPGLDPYTGAVADVYQNLFSEATFVGRGIYDVDAFDTVLGQRLPDNQVLSHDLLEGCYLRAGLLGDAALYEACPARYADDARARHRWMRGDWQLAGWLGRSVPGRAGRRERNPLSMLSRWKLFDNLRRSLVAPSLTLLLLLCWTMSPSPLFWTVAALSVLLLPALVRIGGDALDKPGDVPWRQHLRALLPSARALFGHGLLHIVFLAYEAWLSIDAIVRALWRLLVTRRRMLEWRSRHLSNPAADLFDVWSGMGVSPALALLATVLVWYVNPPALIYAGPVLLAWIVAPAVAWLVSASPRRQELSLHEDQTAFLQSAARKTWHFFDTLAGPEHNWLAPDHVQEHPAQAVDARTSPTTIGLSLLANLSAWDFGFVTTGGAVRRVDEALRALDRMERYQGHFYQWYDTRTLDPLAPLYIASADSGNLAGHLLTLATGLSALADEPVATPQTIEGIAITLRTVEEYLPAGAREAAARLRAELDPQRVGDVRSLPAMGAALGRLQEAAEALAAALPEGADAAAQEWAGKLAQHCREARAELLELAPWLGVSENALVDSRLTRMPSLRELAAMQLADNPDLAPAERERLARLAKLVEQGSARAAARVKRIDALSARAHALAAAMDWRLLYNPATRLLSAGYHVRERRQDPACHELLASTSRLGSFVAIAFGQLPHEHWFALGRQLCMAGGQRLLVSSSGALHEYLMPLVVMPAYRNTLLESSCHAAVAAQADFARARKLPWGMAESGCHALDAGLNYQSRAFGVPDIGLARAHPDEVVVAPYAAMLALMVDPDAASANLRRLADLGLAGRYGFYEAADFTAARLAPGQDFAVVRAWTARHQGLGLLSISHLLHDRPMQRRFEADPLLQATLSVLQERMPRESAIELADGAPPSEGAATAATPARVLGDTTPAHPEVQLLSNGRLHVMLSSAGGGALRWGESAVTRWAPDATCDSDGSFVYLRDLDSGALWSNAYQPTLVEPDRYEVVFLEGRATIVRQDGDIVVQTDIVVSPEDDVELRRIHIANGGAGARRLELTTCVELAAGPVKAELLRADGAILCQAGADGPCVLHAATLHGVDAEASFETSRAAFAGRSGLAAPLALAGDLPLSNRDGTVADPLLAVRYQLTLAAGQGVTLMVATGVAAHREAAVQLAGKYRDRQLCERAFELAWTHGQVLLRQLDASEADAQLYASLAGSVIYPNPALRADAALLARSRRPREALRAYGISGDLPLVLVQVRARTGEGADIALVRQMVRAHAYWRMKGVAADLVILYEEPPGRRQTLRERIDEAIAAGTGTGAAGPGGVFVRLLAQIPEEDRLLMAALARVAVQDFGGSLADQVRRPALPAPRVPPLVPVRAEPPPAQDPEPALQSAPEGGFSADGTQYLVRIDAQQMTPGPRINLLASPHICCEVTESGDAASWSANPARVQLSANEAFYIRDEETGRIWSPAAWPVAPNGDYLTRQTFGVTVFEHAEEGIHSELTMFVSFDAPIRYALLRLRNGSTGVRTLSATGYAEWRLGGPDAIVTEVDPDTGALFARDACQPAAPLAFFHAEGGAHGGTRSVTGDRLEFIGRNGTLAAPAALMRERLSGRTGAGLDPCAAAQVRLRLQPGEVGEVVFLLGAGKRRSADTSAIVDGARGMAAALAQLERVRAYWARSLQAGGATPSERWLAYQATARALSAQAGPAG